MHRKGSTKMSSRVIMIKIPPKQASRILVVCTRRIGDVLLSLPAIKNLRIAYPDSVIDLLLFSGTEGIPSQISYIDNIITVTERPTFAEHCKLFLNIIFKYQLSISFLPGDRPVIYCWVAARIRLGSLIMTRKHAWKRKLLSEWVPHDDLNTHTVIMNLKVVELLGIKTNVNVDIELFSKKKITQNIIKFPQKSPYAVFHISPKFNYKQWRIRGWQELAKLFNEELGIQVVLVGGHGVAEKQYGLDLMQSMPPDTVNLVGQVSLTKLSEGLLGTAIYVGTDTAVTHLAAMLGVPTLALYGPSNVKKWGPWPKNYKADSSETPWNLVGSKRIQNVYLLQGIKDCVPCMLEGCERHPRSNSVCLRDMSSQRVFEAAMVMID